jgi:hypothetical protein
MPPRANECPDLKAFYEASRQESVPLKTSSV